ncbi:MAG: type II toxin-antitoxin system VapC family toxin [Sphingomonadales bacterium]
MKAVFDTNILIDYAKGISAAKAEIVAVDHGLISIVTWMEFLAGIPDEQQAARARRFLDRFEIVPVDVEVAEQAVELRRHHRMKLPDAVIWATAKTHHAMLVTRNTRDFPTERDIRFPYQL